MKYVFFGTPRFAEIVLGGLIAGGTPPVAVVCNPDRPVGRKKVITPPRVKILAGQHGIRVFQPERMADISEELSKLRADCFVVAAYAKIIPNDILQIPRFGALGTHPSLLPKYRGTSPIQSAILEGETETGVTIYQMDEKVDHGAILGQESFPFDSLTTNYEALEKKLAERSAALLLKLFPAVEAGTARARPQDEAAATFTKKFKTEDGFVSPEDLEAAEGGDKKQTEHIMRKINGFQLEPGVWTIQNGKRIKLLKATIEADALKLLLVQEEGQKPKPPAGKR